jgi:hypothetical protein
MKFFGKFQICLILFFTMIGLWSCDPPQNTDCSQLFNCNSALDPVYYYENHTDQYYSPIFNPNDPNEIMYLKMHTDSTGYDSVSLERFNYVTMVHSVVISASNMISSNLNFWKYNWSSTGWIVLENNSNSQIYKVRDDGTLLQQLTSDGNSFYPFLNYTSDKLIFSNYSGTQHKYFGITMDINTNTFLDTIYIGDYLGLGTGILPNKVVCSVQDSVKIIDENSKNILSVFKPESGISGFNEFNFFRNIAANSNEVIFISNFNGIFRLDLTTHTAYLIKAGCTDRVIISPSVSSDGNKIVYAFFKDENTEANPCFIKRTMEIHIMNIDGSNDQVLNLP